MQEVVKLVDTGCDAEVDGLVTEVNHDTAQDRRVNLWTAHEWAISVHEPLVH